MTNHLVGMAEIGEMLEVSRQRVGQLMETYADFPKPEVELTAGRVWSRSAIESWMAMHPERKRGEAAASGGMFERFTERARQAIVQAQEQARALQHAYIGTEHLLLGLLAEGQGLACKALRELGLELESAQSGVIDAIGRGSDRVAGHIPFTPRAKTALELSLGEATQLGHNYISTEHVLLGLLREGGGVAVRLLETHGLEVPKVRQHVLRLMHGSGAKQRSEAESLSVLLAPVIERLDRIEQRLRSIES